MNDQAVQRLHDALRAAEAIPQFLAGATLDEYKANFGMRLQIERLLEIVGEALNQARSHDDEDRIRANVPEIGAIIGMRNRIIHGYNRIDDEVLWDVASKNVVLLTQQLRVLLSSIE